ncbi:metalloregulator ArsR/SmtB family transcription factor [Pseudovibrio sp. SPO723]|uniref:ArsR/SmtB family transcription factor n=1 Tax=Nesiotobacter zosterae TaxID=392721 RepID=UPI0029C2B275|nr:metalloregulator ArsR/SmtB family transcription factor [Pseudovibrio sp. SPO723]MDX5594373.1 metalloregulator ArsR/SmtB family transcription factor [Pseudovibrio sp. SPO723]
MSDQVCCPTIVPVLDQPLLDQELASLCKALSHPARVKLIRIMLAQSGCVGQDLVSALGLAQSTVSEHIRILKEAGLVDAENQRPKVCYSVNEAKLKRYQHLLADALG